jgi:rubrerythrin
MTTPGGGHSTHTAVIATSEDLLARAYAMEVEAMERYDEFAAQMEMHNNLDVAAVFRKLAGAERKHAETMARDLAKRGVSVAASMALAAPGAEGLETDLGDDLHYLMTPYHALEIALRNELRAFAFFDDLARGPLPDDIRRLARGYAQEEQRHIDLVREWLARLAKPEDAWAYDPDEPRMPE